MHALDSVLDAIGNTPLIRLNHIPASEGIRANVYAKCGELEHPLLHPRLTPSTQSSSTLGVP